MSSIDIPGSANISQGEVKKDATLVCTTNHIDSKLYDVIINDNINELIRIDLGDGDQLTPTNNTVLHLACLYGSINCVKHILTVHESQILVVNSRGETALHLAAREGHYDVVGALINAAKSLPNHQVEDAKPVRKLIATTNVEDETALHAAVRYNHNNVVQLLVTEDPRQKHVSNVHGETPLYLASVRCYTDIIKTILDNCRSPRFGGPEGRTALHAAVLDDNDKGRECVKCLLQKNKDLISEQDNYGWTVFHYVAYNDLYTIVEDLVGPNKEVAYLRTRQYKRTALHVAAYKGNVRVMEKLLKYFPDCWDIVDARNQNVFHIAVEQDRKEVIKFILSQGCRASNNLLNQKDMDGNTPLHLIAKFGCYVPELMDLRELDWEVLNNQNLTPLDVLHSGHETVARADQEMIRTMLVSTNVKKHWHLWPALKEPDIEAANSVLKNEKLTKEFEEYRKMISTHMIVAALIATVALTAGFAMPGGFDGNQGPTQGSPLLLKKKSFKIFIATDAVALFLSISSLSLYFITTMEENVHIARRRFFTSVQLNVGSIIAMMVAFITGTYSVLDPSAKQLAITFCVISSFVLLSVYSVLVE